MKPKFIFKHFFITLAVLFFSTSSFVTDSMAHPHLFATTRYTLVFDQQGLAGIKVFWEFDEMYSVMTVEGFDENGNGQFDQKEADELAKLGVENLANFNYFTHITVENKPRLVTQIKKMKVDYKDNHLLYSFYVPCSVSIGKNEKNIKISPYDPEYYAAMFFTEQKSFLYENEDNFIIESNIAEDPDTLIFFDMIHPLALNLTIKRK